MLNLNRSRLTLMGLTYLVTLGYMLFTCSASCVDAEGRTVCSEDYPDCPKEAASSAANLVGASVSGGWTGPGGGQGGVGGETTAAASGGGGSGGAGGSL